MNYIDGRLGFNEQENRFGLLINDLFVHNFHCGETLEVKSSYDDEWVKTRFEMTIEQRWYLVGTKYIGSNLENLRARIIKK